MKEGLFAGSAGEGVRISRFPSVAAGCQVVKPTQRPAPSSASWEDTVSHSCFHDGPYQTISPIFPLLSSFSVCDVLAGEGS